MSRHHPTDPAQALEAQARRRVGMKMGFYTHAFVFVCVNLGLFVLNQAVPGATRWQPPLTGWGLGLAIHGLVVFIHLAGGGLRERMLKTELDKLRQASH